MHGWLHLEECDEIGEKQRLIGDAGCGRKDLLEIGACLLNGRSQESELPNVIGASKRAPDDVHIRAVIA